MVNYWMQGVTRESAVRALELGVQGLAVGLLKLFFCVV